MNKKRTCIPDKLARDVAIALHMRANYIETGNTVLSFADVRERGAAYAEQAAALEKWASLTDAQRKLIDDLRELANKL